MEGFNPNSHELERNANYEGVCHQEHETKLKEFKKA